MRKSRALTALPVAVTLLALTPAVADAAAAGSPQLVRIDGGGADVVHAVAVDGAGNLYLAGRTDTSASSVAFSVVKVDAQGQQSWRARYDGSRGGVLGAASAVAVDGAGNVYAAGHISSATGVGANIDLLVVKFGPDGVQRWAQRYDTPDQGREQATRIVVDQSGSAYVAGNAVGATGGDWLTQRYAADGTPLWTRRHTGPGNAEDTVSDLVLTPGGTVVVAGIGKLKGDGVTNDTELINYDPQGAVVWQRTWTDTTISHETVRDVDVDAAGRLVVTGSTAQNASPEFGIPAPVTLRYDPAGTLLGVLRTGGDAADTDAGGNAYVSGSFAFAGQPGPAETAKISSAGAVVWRTPLQVGGNESLFVVAVAVDSAGAVTIAGTVTDGSSLNRDYLTVRLAADGRELWRQRFAGTSTGADEVAGLVVDGTDAAIVAGTSASGTSAREDMVALKFPAGASPAPTPLPAPSALSATATSRSRIQLRWQDNSTAESGFRIERCQGTGCTAFIQIATTAAGATSFVDTGLTRNTSYTYRVRAFNAAGTSAYSNSATARTRN